MSLSFDQRSTRHIFTLLFCVHTLLATELTFCFFKIKYIKTILKEKKYSRVNMIVNSRVYKAISVVSKIDHVIGKTKRTPFSYRIANVRIKDKKKLRLPIHERKSNPTTHTTIFFKRRRKKCWMLLIFFLQKIYRVLFLNVF